jgi:polyisoprenoid-binding protein YceI
VEATSAAKLAPVTSTPKEALRTPEPVSDWIIAPGGQLRFTASWAGIPVEGRFGSWGGKVRFSPDVLDQTNIIITVDLGSVNTNDSQRDGTIKGADFFNTSSYPRAVFTATKARALGGNRYAVDGTLDLHGVTQPASLTFTLKIDGKTARVSGGTRLDRTRFGVGSGEYASTDQIAGGVAVNFSFVAGR